jgi:hypothetical protein
VTLPSPPTKVHLDASSDDPKQARGELADHVDVTAAILTHLNSSTITSTPATVGDGLEISSSALRAKLNGSTLLRSGSGLSVNAGTGASQIVQLNGSSQLPAVSGVNLTGIPLFATVGNYISGLTLSNNGTDPTNDIDIAAGVAMDDANTGWMQRTTSITKRLDANWAVGTNQGGLDTGSMAGSTTYHVWLIRRPDTGVNDVLFSLSASSPTMPANYTQKRRIGSILTTSVPAIRSFIQTGDEFILNSRIQDVLATGPGTSAVTRTLTVPTGITVKARFSAEFTDLSYGGQTFILVTDLAQTDAPPSSTQYNLRILGNSGDVEHAMDVLDIRTNTSGQIRTRQDLSTADHGVAINTLGWIDERGRNG